MSGLSTRWRGSFAYGKPVHCRLKRDLEKRAVFRRHKLNEHAIWIASVGHDVHSGEDAPLALISYCGVQLLY